MKQSMMAQLTKLYQAVYVELPLEAARSWIGGDRKSVEVAGWAAYDSFVAVANELTNQLYANRLVAASFGRALETTFHALHILDAFAPTSGSLSSEPLRVNSGEPVVPSAELDEAQRATVATRRAVYAEAAAQYRSAARARRPRRGVAA